jgi:hypothetical protein
MGEAGMKERGWKHHLTDALGTFITGCMAVSRVCLIDEVLASLRALPKESFEKMSIRKSIAQISSPVCEIGGILILWSKCE